MNNDNVLFQLEITDIVSTSLAKTERRIVLSHEVVDHKLSVFHITTLFHFVVSVSGLAMKNLEIFDLVVQLIRFGGGVVSHCIEMTRYFIAFFQLTSSLVFCYGLLTREPFSSCRINCINVWISGFWRCIFFSYACSSIILSCKEHNIVHHVLTGKPSK